MAKYVTVRYLIEVDQKVFQSHTLIREFNFHIDINEQIEQIYGAEAELTDTKEENVSLSLVDDGQMEVTLRIPVPDTAGSEFLLYIFSIILGNIIRGAKFTKISLRELNFPSDVMATLPGPVLGHEKLKKFLECEKTNILSVPLAAHGFAVQDSVSKAIQLVKAGIHLVPDSPVRYYKNLEECQRYIEGFIEATVSADRKAICFINGNFGSNYLNKLVHRLKLLSEDLNWPIGLRVDPMLVGIATMEQLRKSNLPLFCYSQFNRLLYSSSAGLAIHIMTEILRNVGADIISIGIGKAETYDKQADIHASVSSMLKPVSFKHKKKQYEIPKTLPMLTGGITTRFAHEIAWNYSTNVGFHIGKHILTGPLSLEENVAAFKESIQAGVQKVPYDDFIKKGARSLVKYERALKNH